MSVVVVHSDDYLAHYGVKFMKWGVRRYQNEDGSLTSLGKEHYGVGKSDDSSDGSNESNEAKEPKISKREQRKQLAEERKKIREETKIARRNVRNLTNEELQERINRLNKEKQLDQLLQEQAARSEDPMRAKVHKLLSDAAEDLTKKTLAAVTQTIVNKATEKLNKKDVFDVGKYKDMDLFKLKSDEIAKVYNTFEQLGKIAENRDKAVKSNNGGNNQNNQNNNQNNSQNNNQNSNQNPIGKKTKKKINRMKAEGKSAEEIAKSLDIAVDVIKKFAFLG